jgi:hypothetical protein
MALDTMSVLEVALPAISEPSVIISKKKRPVVAPTASTASTVSTVTAVPQIMTDSKEQSQIDIDSICEHISKNTDKSIILLRNKEVIMWLFGDLSFLPPIEKKNKTVDEGKYKILEDKWGQEMLKKRRPDLKLDKQWTNKFGEHICEELFTLLGKKVSKPIKKVNYQPDSEVDDAIIEAKAGTFHTGGTAGEKILGCPFKYAEIPYLYSKPLKIVCMGGAEKVCREQYGNLPGPKCSVQKKKYLDFFKQENIEYIGATDILQTLIN